MSHKPITVIGNFFDYAVDNEEVEIGELYFCLRCDGVGLFDSRVKVFKDNLPFIKQKTAKKDLIKYNPKYNSHFTHKCSMSHWPLLKHKR